MRSSSFRPYSSTIERIFYCLFTVLGKKKTNKHKEFWRDTPWCASRLSRRHVPSVPWYVPPVPGTFCPFSIELHMNQAQMSQVSLGRPEFVPGTPPGHLTAKFLYVIFLYRFFSPYCQTVPERFRSRFLFEFLQRLSQF